jgi:pyruvate/2-oxoglutarate/acetoin dehydrogenase E1 component
MSTFVDGLNQALHHEMENDPSLLVLGEDVARLGGLFNVTAGLYERFPARVLDTPISEGGFAGMAVGAAVAGHRVVVEIQIIDFLWQAADQIANAGNMHFVSNGQVSVPVVFRGPCTFGTGFGVTHTQRLEGVFASRPGVKVLMPGTPADAKGLLTSAIRDPNPVVIFEDVALYYAKGELGADGDAVPIGEAHVVRAGSDCTVASAGRGVGISLSAAKQLAERGVEAEVIDLRSIKPVDWTLLEASTNRTGAFVAALDGPPVCSYAGFLCSEIARRCWIRLRAAPTAVTGLDVASAVSRVAEESAAITSDHVAATVERLAGIRR